jgi:curved DNA-binding protein CbpA
VAVIVDRADPYAVLGLTRRATQEQVRRAYRALLRRYHPDTCPAAAPADDAAATRTLQQVLAAYAILGDPGRRADYDDAHREPGTTTGTGGQGRIRWAAPFPSAPCPSPPWPRPERDQPPIRAGPVRWHGRPA